MVERAVVVRKARVRFSPSTLEKMVKKKQKKIPKINFGKRIIFEIFLAFTILLILYSQLGLEGIRKYIMWIILVSGGLILIITLILLLTSKKIINKIEPEDNKELLELMMNQSINYVILLIGLSVSLIIPGITLEFSRRIGLILLIGLFFQFIAIVLFNMEYLPRLNKLLIKIGEDLKK